MNNQITILDRNNQSINVDLICYFSTNNKKYIFYNKNETVQDGLIKMYVAEENMGLNNDISQGEWDNLKKIMQGIITGNNGDIQFLSYNSPVIFNEAKAIALNDSNINILKSAYKSAIPNSETVLNKDILTQNFGSANTTIEASSEPVQISPIPNIQNTFNMESTPVNLNLEPSVLNENTSVNSEEVVIEPNVNSVDIPSIVPINPSVENTSSNNQPDIATPNLDIPAIEPIIPTPVDLNIPGVEAVDSSNENNDMALNINSIKPGGIDSGFKVSNEPNIFDNPIITEEEINKVEVPEVNVSKVELSNSNINSRQIEINNRKIKLFEELANIYREENELLSSNDIFNNDLENTASNLFNNNGTLNDSIIN